MTETKGIIAIVVGFVAIVFAFACKQFYYGPNFTAKRPAPLWYGRTLFLIVGAAFLFVGISFFFTSQ
jgi:uncharacterized membrane protein HdeD (DUF308 family)